MKYRKDGRVYKTVRHNGCCNCVFGKTEYSADCEAVRYEVGCPYGKMWRETIPPKIRNWLNDKLFCYWEPTLLHYYVVSCGCEKNIFHPRLPICPKCHRIVRIKR